MTSAAEWTIALGLSEVTPWAAVIAIALVAVFIFGVLPSLYFYSYLQRKWVSDLQARVGPNRAGPAGVFQPIALAMMNLLKRGDQEVGIFSPEWIWFHIRNAILFSSLALLPIGGALALVNTDLSTFLVFWVILATTLCTFFLGSAQRGGLGLLGASRETAQMLAGMIPAMFCLLLVSSQAPGLSWRGVSEVQGFFPHEWLILRSPGLFLAFPIFLMSGMVMMGVHPFGPSNAAVSLFSGRALLLIRFSRIYAFFVWSMMASVLFLGSWRLPEGLESGGVLTALLQTSWVFIKAVTVMLGSTLIASVLPGWRSDQTVQFSWIVLAPLALLLLLVSAAIRIGVSG